MVEEVEGDPTDSEASLEKLMYDMGVERQQSTRNRAYEKDRGSITYTGSYLLRTSISTVSDHLKGIRKMMLKKELKASGVSHNHPMKLTFRLLGKLRDDVVAYLACRAVIDALARKSSLHAMALRIGARMEDEQRFIAFSKQHKGIWKMELRKVANRGYKAFRRSIAVQMKAYATKHETWTYGERAQVGLQLLEIVHQATGIISIRKVWKGPAKSVNVVIATDAIIEWIEKSDEKHDVLFPFFLPTVIPPNPWKTLYGGGYFTAELRRYPIIKRKVGVDINYSELEGVDLSPMLSSFNAMQNTGWNVNEDVFQVANHFWNLGRVVADLPPREDEKIPTRPPQGCSDDIYRVWSRQAARIHKHNDSIRSRRILAAKTFFIAEKFRGKRFFYPYHADFRGRAYPTPYFLQPQGHGQARGLLTFAEPQPIENKEEAEWLAIQGANTWGYDKVTFEERHQWVDDNSRMIRDVAQDPIECMDWEEADKPWEFLAFCIEWSKFQAKGYGYESGLPVNADGSNNGLQIFSLLLRDMDGARATNVMPTTSPQDVYADVAAIATEKLKVIALNTRAPLQREDAIKWLKFAGGAIPRKAVKRAVMCTPYGLTRWSALEHMADWYRSELEDGAVSPWEGEAYKKINMLNKVVWSSIGDVVASAHTVMDWLQDCALIFARHGLPVKWSLPTGMIVTHGYFKSQERIIKTVIGDQIRTSNFTVDAPGYNDRKMVQAIPPNYVHSLDAAAMMGTVNLCHKRGVRSFKMVHDGYGTTAHSMPTMALSLREEYRDLFIEDRLLLLFKELRLQLPRKVELPEPPPRGTEMDVREVVNSPYFFA